MANVSIDSREILNRLPSARPGAMTMTGVKDIRELRAFLESEHPLYSKMKKLWCDLANLYLGDNIQDYIFRHQREKDPNWAKRKERAYYFNYTQSIVDLTGSFIFSKAVNRQWESPEEREAQIRELRMQQIMFDAYQKRQGEIQQQAQQEQYRKDSLNLEKAPEPPSQPDPEANGAPAELPPEEVEQRVQELLSIQTNTGIPELSEFWENVDLRGTNIDQFSLFIYICAQVWGFVDVFMDMNQTPDDVVVETEADRKKLGLRPYAFAIFPQDMLNWELGSDGKFKWVRWREEIVGDIGPWEKRPEKKSYRYYTWTRENFWVHEVRPQSQGAAEPEVQEVASGENPLGEIPIVRFFNKKHMIEPILGISAIKDIAKINVQILNICSLLDEEMYSKMFNLLVMQGGSERKGSIEIGNNNVLLWEGEGQAPFYLSPTSEPSQFMMDMIRMCIQEIYRIAKLGGDTGVQEAQSGIAYTWEFNQTNRMLADKADAMERGEMELHRFWAMWMGLEWKGVVDYPDNFNVEKFEDEVKRVVDVKAAIRSPEFKRIMEKRLASRAMSKSSPIERARVFAEIDVMAEEKQSFYPTF